MKILHIIQRYYPAVGGAESYMKELSEYFAQSSENHVEVWTSNALPPSTLVNVDGEKVERASEVINGVKVRRFPVAPWYLSLRNVNKLFRVGVSILPFWKTKYWASCPTVFGLYKAASQLQKNDFDVIHVSAAPQFGLFNAALQASRKTGARLFLSPFLHLGTDINDPIRTKYLVPWSVPFYCAADKIFIQTDAEKKAIIDLCQSHGCFLKLSKFEKLGVGIHVDEMLGGNGEHFREKYNLGNSKIVFYIGARTAGKGVINLVEAMRRLWSAGKDYRLVLAGGDTTEFLEYWNVLPQKVKDKILCLGYISDDEKKDLLAAGNVMSMVSHTDSFGIIYLESWCYQKPVLACKTPVIAEIVDDNKCGFLVEFNDIESIAAKLDELLTDNSLAKTLGANGYQKLMQNYNWSDIFDKFEKVYYEK